MNLEEVKRLSYEDLRKEYTKYLKSINLSETTISTAKSDTFYIWKNGSKEDFWNLVLSEDFERIAENEILEVLRLNSTGNIESLSKSYLTNLRRFRKFIYSSHLKLAKVDNNMNKVASALEVPKPNEKTVNHYLRRWTEIEDNNLQERALNKLFLQLCPKNTEIEDVLLKAATLNDFYSTNIYSIYPVAKHILLLNIDERLREGDLSLVRDIQRVVISNKEINFYSFATKYCSHHNENDYPIYDSYVDEVLRYFRKKDSFDTFNNDELKDYIRFKEILIQFRNFYCLHQFSLKQIDQYIWLLGKEYFPKSYGKKRT